MKEIYISTNQELKYFLKLFQILNYLFLYFDIIYIYSDHKYLSINNTLFFNFDNVIFIENDSNIINSVVFNDEITFIENLNIQLFQISNLIHINFYRNNYQENIFYLYLIDNITSEYIFYFNNIKETNNKIINYFGDLYIYNPFSDFYEDEDEKYFSKWKELCLNNYSYFLKIIENAKQLHIYDIDMLYLILEIDTKHIKEKYFYYNDILLKEKENKLLNWNIIQI